MNNMTNKQIERYLDILEERNQIADRVEDKTLNRLDNFDLQNGQLVCLKEIASALSSIAHAIENKQ